MALHLHQTVKQTQKLVLTQELKLGIELLNLTNLELSDRIQSELQENPLLEESENVPRPEAELLDSKAQNAQERQSLQQEGDYFTSHEFNADAGSNFTDFSAGSADDNSKRSFLEGAVQSDETLADHLDWQLRLTKVSQKVAKIVRLLITNLDEKGFLISSAEEFIGSLVEKGEITKCSANEITKALATLHSFDPVGVGAQSVQESLFIQCKHYRPRDKKLQLLLEEHFALLESLEYETLAKKLDAELDDVMDYARYIATLDPFPGSSYNPANRSNYIQPDIAVVRLGKNHQFQYLDGYIPNIEINEAYQKLLKQKRKETKLAQGEREFIQERLSSAQALLKSISFRRDSLLSVIGAIYKIQQDWFFSGNNVDLKPMTLKDIAEITEISESAISRITSRKHVQTEWGLYSLKFFFSSSVTNKYGEKDSAKKIMDIIKNLIEKENPEQPLSDLALEKELSDQGITVARRTIAKYRKILEIPYHSTRKKIAKLKRN